MRLLFDDTIPRDFDRMHAEVEVRMKDGTRFSERIDRLSGWCGIPLSREQRMAKFLDCSARVIARDTAEHVAALVERLECLGEITEIMAAVGARPAP